MSHAILEPSDSQVVAEDCWSVAESEKNGRPFIVRFRSGRPQGVDPAAFPFLLSATWTYRANESGLPAADETELMDKFEDALASALEKSQTAHLMVVLTHGGERDWLWYAVGEDAAMNVVNQALRGHPRYPVEFSVQKDRAWRAYTQFVGGNAGQANFGGSLFGWVVGKAMQILGR